MVVLDQTQLDAVKRLRSGSVLANGVGSGKTVIALTWFVETYIPRKPLIIITTAKKRNTNDWQKECERLGIKNYIVDSWNAIKKYQDLTDNVFIFDEQHAKSFGTWGQSLIKIAKKNEWILLSATPGDRWIDYAGIFVANGFFRNKTEFCREHVIYSRFAKFPMITGYMNTSKLEALRDSILVKTDGEKKRAKRVRIDLKYHITDKIKDNLKILQEKRWNIYEDRPIENVSELMACVRKLIYTDPRRVKHAIDHIKKCDRVIVFYNYNYELDALVNIVNELGMDYAEYNGRVHEDIPKTENWVYFVNYNAGAEGWNCIKTNKILFYSMNYSWSIMEQCEGRIDRRNTPYKELLYYNVLSDSNFESLVVDTVANKKKFNDVAYAHAINF